MTTNEKALKMHEEWHGKIETTAKSHVHSREDLSIAYTPGVAEPCKAIAKDKEAAYKVKHGSRRLRRERGARTWQHRRPCRYAGHGGKGRTV